MHTFEIKQGYPLLDGEIPTVLRRPSEEECSRAYDSGLLVAEENTEDVALLGDENESNVTIDDYPPDSLNGSSLEDLMANMADLEASTIDSLNASADSLNASADSDGRRLSWWWWWYVSSSWTAVSEKEHIRVSSSDLAKHDEWPYSTLVDTNNPEKPKMTCETRFMGGKWGKAQIHEKEELCYKVTVSKETRYLTYYPWYRWQTGRTKKETGPWYRCKMYAAWFEGTDFTSAPDVATDIAASPGGPDGKYHLGFYAYQAALAPCMNSFRRQLRHMKGRDLHYLLGRSLGGAAATIYAQEHGNAELGVLTYGAPRTNYFWSGKWLHCDFRRVAKRVQKKVNQCARSWWKFWCWFELIWETVVETVKSCYMKVGISTNTWDSSRFVMEKWSAIYGFTKQRDINSSQASPFE
eukprot:CAMPEP_0115393798 /NCGR_PEP_ID=MMETSP0271-20121206/11937_1 /TAXON_ID=71861 /ORGANISM="Scrippsiella trochoidea, Strain CCMP3099" /LENGTH=409 /DNA_ID=CAMNT_0002817451 /DNA_START=9 /DNA_END=1236 /DNA_ORIENTATION=+